MDYIVVDELFPCYYYGAMPRFQMTSVYSFALYGTKPRLM